MKKHGWPELLHDYIDAARLREFAYGAFDCALFCADWVQIATGIDHAVSLRGYDSMAAAYKIIAGYGSIEAMVTALMARDPVHAAFAQRGDIMLVRDHASLGSAPEGLGICLGLHTAVPRDKGLLMIRTLEAASAWKVD